MNETENLKLRNEGLRMEIAALLEEKADLMLHKDVVRAIAERTHNMENKRLRAFCEGLEMNGIDKLMTGTVGDFKRVGIRMAQLIKQLRARLEATEKVIEVAEEFQRKVETGRARSKDTYGKFKQALANWRKVKEEK
jgi:hypothetical protein